MGDENLVEGGNAVADLVGLPDLGERCTQDDPALADHRDVIRDLFHFIQQVRREDDRSTFVGDGQEPLQG